MTVELTSPVESLVDFLNMKPSEKKIRFNHNPGYKILPLFTRTDERYKFQDEFLEVTGIISRLSQNKEAKLENISDRFLEKLRLSLDIQNDVTDSELLELFQTSFSSARRAQLLAYIPISRGKEGVGKQQVAKFMVDLLGLKENNDWQRYIAAREESDLYSTILSDALPELKDDSYENKFVIQNSERYRKLFDDDFHALMESENYNFISLNIDRLLSYYLVLYLINEGPTLGKLDTNTTGYYFAYEKEKVSASRAAVTNGYERIKSDVNQLLVYNDITDYINVLIGNIVIGSPETYGREVSIANILESGDNKLKQLIENLRSFNQIYAEANDKQYAYSVGSTEIKEQVLQEINQLKGWISEDMDIATQGRFKKTYDEIRNLGYLKSRGRLGSVLNASQELILLFTAIVVGSNEHMLVKNVFAGLEQHGLRFDKQSKKEIVDFFEEVNLLEKMSDSGDAQYVKPIL